MSTDKAWEEWGQRDPYFGVITNKKFRRTDITSEAKAEFFESGRVHVEYVMQMIHQYINPQFVPNRVLDFGCGVGRLAVPFASIAPEVVGLDVSTGMLAEAHKNLAEMGVANVTLVESDDELTRLTGDFDLIHSYIVFQHIPPERGREIFKALLGHLRPGGVGALHFAYSKAHFAANHGVPPESRPTDVAVAVEVDAAEAQAQAIPTPANADPEMQMNPYPATELLFALQLAGVHRFHAEFTDHGGELGIFLFFQKTAA